MKHTRGSYWCVPGRHTTTEKGHVGLRLAEPQESSHPTRNKELTWISHSLPGGVVFFFFVFVFFFNLLRNKSQPLLHLSPQMFKKHLLSTLGQTLCPRNGEDIVPVPKELEVQPRRWMGNQRHTFGVKRVKVGRGCAAHFGKSGNASWRK